MIGILIINTILYLVFWYLASKVQVVEYDKTKRSLKKWKLGIKFYNKPGYVITGLSYLMCPSYWFIPVALAFHLYIIWSEIYALRMVYKKKLGYDLYVRYWKKPKKK